MAQLTSKQVWQELETQIFAVLGMVTAQNEACEGSFITYGVGVSLMGMRHRAQARGRAAIA